MKSEQLQIRVSPRQKATLKQRAALAGQGMSSYVLSRVLPASEERFAALLDAVREPDEWRFALAGLNDLLVELP